ncbi:hypothetical protein VNO77_42690 [Canavalia gladiata]|uniref:Uncharacterized protein n=1 Tax=Canavalia gladiata TaxID=3824 RepID=A0AAN9JVI8_CANGL
MPLISLHSFPGPSLVNQETHNIYYSFLFFFGSSQFTLLFIVILACMVCWLGIERVTRMRLLQRKNE